MSEPRLDLEAGQYRAAKLRLVLREAIERSAARRDGVVVGDTWAARRDGLLSLARLRRRGNVQVR